MSEAPIWDKPAAMERVDDDLELFIEIFDIFLEEYPNDIKTLRLAVEENDTAAIEARAHAIKSGLGNLGAMQCHDLAFALEHLGRTSDADAVSLLTQLEGAIQAFLQVIQEERKTLQ